MAVSSCAFASTIVRERGNVTLREARIVESFEQIDLLHDYVRRVERDTQRDPSLPAIQFFGIDVSFDAIDPAERRYFMDLSTSFSLTEEQVDRLREIGGRLLRQSPEFQRMLRDLGAPPG